MLLNKCVYIYIGSGVARWGHGVTESEFGPADTSLGDSAQLGQLPRQRE